MDITLLKKQIENRKKTGITSEFQYNVNVVWEMLDRKISFPLLARLYKTKPAIFNRSRDYIYGMIRDGIPPENKASYFMWLIKHYGKETNTTSK